MENDLDSVAMDALDALESTEGTENAEDTTLDEEVSENENTEATEQEETATDGEESDSEEKPEEPEEEKKEEPEKKELTDEEFEKMASERGYSKKQEEPAKEKTEEDTLERPEEIDEQTWNKMPEVNKIIYNNLPYLSTVDKNGREVVVKTPDQLPNNFEFLNKKTETKFMNDLVAQENRATKLSERLEYERQQYEETTARVNNARQIIGEIETLQKSGDLPTPKAKAGTKDFDNDPAVNTINHVLAFRQERASQGYTLSMADATALYKMQHPDEFGTAKAKGDNERFNLAKKVAGNAKSGGNATNSSDEENKPNYYRAGMSMEDVVDRALEDME